jgi:LysM repeat protein
MKSAQLGEKYPNAKKISQIIQQLNDLRDQADDESKTKIDQALNSIPQKFAKDWIAKKVAQDGHPALYGLKPGTGTAASTATSTDVAAPAAAAVVQSAPGKKITWQDLAKLNPQIKDPNKIYPGDEVKLPNNTSAVVNKGDTLGSIAKDYNDGNYNDGTPVDAPSTNTAQPAATPTNTDQAAATPSSSPASATVPITPEITSRARKLNNAIGMLGIDAGAVDNVFKSIPNKETFLAVSQEYKRISGKDLIRELNGSWTHKAELVVNPLLKKWGIPPLAEQNEVLNIFSRMENYK